MRIKILGTYWDFKFAPNLGPNFGYCDPASSSIRVQKGLDPKHEFEITVHEINHAGDLDKCEEWIDEYSHDLVNVLHKLGYRRLKGQELKEHDDKING